MGWRSDEDGSPQPLRANRDFTVIAAGQAVSALGDAISLTAMPLLVLQLTGSGALMGLVGALQFLPDLVLGLVAGALADRWDRRRMIMWSDAGRALLVATIPISWWLDADTMAVILIMTVPINTLRLFSDAGLTSAIPALVGRDHLGRANAVLEATLSVPYIIGPAVAGVLAEAIGPAPTLAIDASSFLFSAASAALVRRELRAERREARRSIVADIRAGMSYVWRHAVLRSIIGYWSTVMIATAGLIPVLSYYITIDRELSPRWFGTVGSLWSVGYLIGSLLLARFQGWPIRLRMLAPGFVIAAALCVIATSRHPATYAGAAAGIGAGLAVLLVSYATMRARLTPDEYLGRVGSTARTLSLGLQPLGMLGAGAVIEAADARAALWIMAAVVVAATLVLGASGTMRRVEAAEGPRADAVAPA